MLKLEHISVSYGKKQVLYDISFEIKKGEFVLMVGPNGSGKTTLLKTIYGFIRPMRTKPNGAIFFDGKEITHGDASTFISEGLMYVPQRDNYFENLNFETNIQISGSTLSNFTEFSDRLEEVYDVFPSLRGHSYSEMMKMSGGEKQMTVLAMALIHRPKMILLDEPTLSLSPHNVILVLQKLKEINEIRGRTILMIEHKVRDSLKYASRVIGIKLGRVYGEYPIDAHFDKTVINKILI